MKSLTICLFLIAIVVVGQTCAVSLPYQEFYITQFVDHFNFQDDRTFQLRYLVNDDYFDREHGGPVLFYTGNEGDITGFWDNTGFMFDIAPLFNGLIVFCEHRYYGVSLPFGNQSFTHENIRYLTVEQALADFAVFLPNLTAKYQLTQSNPVIAFGGSYGGMLAAWMRFKYPNLVLGAIAASAPIYLIGAPRPDDNKLFFSAVTDDYSRIPGCVPLIRQAFDEMNKTLASPNGYQIISDKFKLCNPISDQAGYNHLLGWLRNAFTTMTMGDYPYSASFLGNLPAWPVNASCSLLMDEYASGVDILTAIKDLAGIVYNDTTETCFDIYEQYVECVDPTGCGLGNDALAWDYQACVELNTVQETNGVTDMFPPIPFDNEIRHEYCKRTWGINIRDEWPNIEFWGRSISAASNIVFSNGLLDPWHAGGVLNNISDTVVAVIIADGAHHLDIRGSNPADPDSVIQARLFHIENIVKWITASQAHN